ncbi:MAG: 50S ribosomal protein L17 [Chitinophagales bacterium]|jgi:large subunit ribosomal protein L17|nr:50S ribosomal protein L17 [Bacteroidota bacterium]MBK7566373.1 50S ribosomal protein L17 [Bacteroidota bacterium]MBP8915740.1 50S ribosomal protein L17 [Chitinophagales bacterium]MBP9220425.1 50S ribosomal protein L17 [Chitinophagales bacterium]MBP9795675.1 50S ribosomal protein L17 [Chitinophagales bacterium]
MRHGNKINHLGRKYAHRSAMLSNMGVSLLLHKRIKTTLAKAKELRVYIEPIITRSKEDTTHNRREVFSELQSKEAVNELFVNISAKVATRNGGYTRILKLAEHRAGDNAETCIIELVDYNENMLKAPKGATKKRSRRGSGSGKTEKKAVEAEVKAPVAETIVEETPVVDATEDTAEKEKE